jgi:hypothetical protein
MGGAGPLDGGSTEHWIITPCPSEAPSPLVGEWVGNIGHVFPSGSNAVHLAIERADGNTFCGSITFGAATPPPPVTDRNVGYPPGVDLQEMSQSSTWNAPYEGFTYRIAMARGGPYEGGIPSLSFRFRGYEVWDSWCSGQPSYRIDDDQYRCIPSGNAVTTRDAGADGGAECALVDPAGQSTVMNCDKLLLCGGFSHAASVCYCDGARCTASARENTFGVSGDIEGNRMNASTYLFGATSWFDLVKK